MYWHGYNGLSIAVCCPLAIFPAYHFTYLEEGQNPCQQGPPWVCPDWSPTSGDAMRGTRILILVKSVSIVYVPCSIDLFFAASNVKVLWSFIRWTIMLLLFAWTGWRPVAAFRFAVIKKSLLAILNVSMQLFPRQHTVWAAELVTFKLVKHHTWALYFGKNLCSNCVISWLFFLADESL